MNAHVHAHQRNFARFRWASNDNSAIQERIVPNPLGSTSASQVTQMASSMSGNTGSFNVVNNIYVQTASSSTDGSLSDSGDMQVRWAS